MANEERTWEGYLEYRRQLHKIGEELKEYKTKLETLSGEERETCLAKIERLETKFLNFAKSSIYYGVIMEPPPTKVLPTDVKKPPRRFPNIDDWKK